MHNLQHKASLSSTFDAGRKIPTTTYIATTPYISTYTAASNLCRLLCKLAYQLLLPTRTSTACCCCWPNSHAVSTSLPTVEPLTARQGPHIALFSLGPALPVRQCLPNIYYHSTFVNHDQLQLCGLLDPDPLPCLGEPSSTH